MRILSWILAIFVAFVFIQSLFFKFTGATESILIFSLIDITVDEYLGEKFFEPVMRYAVGGAEAVASLLVLLPFTRQVGAFLGFCILGGAIGFHLLTALGISPEGYLADDGTVTPGPLSQAEILLLGDGVYLETGPTLFAMAVATFIACAVLLIIGSGRSSR